MNPPFKPFALECSARAAMHPTVVHRRRLREIWRSAGWPVHDMLEAELLAWGLLQRVPDTLGRDTLRVTDAGIQMLVQDLNRNRAARTDHERLVGQVAQTMARAGRIAWRGLSLRAPLKRPVAAPAGEAGPMPPAHETRWAMAMPDVFSLRHTTVEAYLEPIVHEVKVRRADLLSDVRNPSKREAYLALSGQCWYVLAAGIGDERDVPAECGVMVQRGNALEVLRPAPRHAVPITLGTWMALARATPERDDDAREAQGLLMAFEDTAQNGTSPDTFGPGPG
jgi:hypothetical protein